MDSRMKANDLQTRSETGTGTKKITSMEYYNNILCVQVSELIGAGIVTESYYKQLNARKQVNVIRRACRNTPALIAVDSLPKRYRDRMIEVLGNPKDVAPRQTFEDRVIPDPSAMQFFSGYRTISGKQLPDEKIREYCQNAAVLNALQSALSEKKSVFSNRGTKIWDTAAQTLGQLKAKLGHTLPENPIRLKDKYRNYIKEGYSTLVSGKFCNKNSRKVNDRIEHIILSLYTMKNKPYATSTHEMYLQFLAGMITVADYQTGEIFDRNDFYDQKGNPIVISESTVWNIVNDPKNRAIVDKIRMGSLDYESIHRPHHHRKSPEYSFSKISMDDRDLPRKMADGNRVKAYYAYDVTSGCVIGRSYSRKKTTGLFIDCMRDMFRFINSYKIGMPMEVEVEHHIVNQFADDIMRAGILFPFVRWCNPGNSQEKRAEHFNKAKKYGYEKRYQEGIGRFYSKLEANRPKVDKIFDEDNNNYKEKTFTFEELVADDLDVIEKYNNDLHRDQKKYPGKTRLQVMLEHKNPNMAEIDQVMLTRYLGECTRTSVRRSMYVRVQYQDYQLSSPEVLDNLNPNNYEVEAYYMPGDDIQNVYIFQDGVYIDSCHLIEDYNEATAEQTEADHKSYTDQAKYVSRFDKMVKDGKNGLSKITVIPNVPPEIETVKATPSPIDQETKEEEIEFDLNNYLEAARRRAHASL